MANSELVAILRRGVAYWNAWRDQNTYRRQGFDFVDADLTGLDLSAIRSPSGTIGANLSDSNFSGARLSGAKLDGVNLQWSTLEGADLTGTVLRSSTLVYSNLRKATLRQADLRKADIRIADFWDADLYKADLRNVRFTWRTRKPDLWSSRNYIFIYCSPALADELRLHPFPEQPHQSATREAPANDDSRESWPQEDSEHNQRIFGQSLAGYDLRGKCLDDLDLSTWDLSNTKCNGASFRRANLSHCSFENAQMEDAILEDSALSHCRMNGAILRRALLNRCDLRNASLVRATLESAELNGVNLANADLNGAVLSETFAVKAKFVGAQMSDCDLQGARLDGADFTDVTLTNAALTRASVAGARFVRGCLRQAKLDKTDLNNVDFSDANIQETDFRGSVGLSKAAILGATTRGTSGQDSVPIQKTRNCRLAYFDAPFLEELGFPDAAGHNRRLESKEFRNLDLSRSNLKGADFSGQNLRGACFAGANLAGAQLANACLREATMDGVDLADSNLSAADLTAAHLKGASFEGASAEGANLAYSDLRGARLGKARLVNAILTRTLLRDAVLEGADLTGVTGLYADQLAGTNLNGARLPVDLGQFSALKNIEGITLSARGLMLSQILLCAYAVIQVASIKDADFLTDRNILSSPLLDMRAPLLFFVYGCPLVLLLQYLWTHFYLQHLWEELAQLPAIFQDSRKLYRKVYPWFLSAFVSAHFPILKTDRPLFTHLQILCAVAITWWLVPFTILLLWARYLRSHDLFGTLVQMGVLSIAFMAATSLQLLAGATLQGKERRAFIGSDSLKTKDPRDRAALLKTIIRQCTLDKQRLIALSVVVGLVCCLTLMSIAATRACGIAPGSKRWLNASFERVAHNVCAAADFSDADISTKGSGWRGDEVALVAGPQLPGRDLRQAIGRRAFLAKANLRGAHLEGADLAQSDLRWADLSGAHLERANLSGADLRGAQMTGAYVERTALCGAQVENAVGLGETQGSRAPCY